MTKVAILGYGRMGKTIEKLANRREMQIHVIINHEQDWDEKVKLLEQVDVAIDFSTPATAFSNIMKCFELDIPIVSGTTGWLEQLDEVKAIISEQDKTFLYGSNFSLGMNVFFKINQMLAKLLQPEWQYACKMVEAHHIHKVDRPSGTAITIAEQIMKHQNYHGWSLENAGAKEIPIEVIREGEIKGMHEVTYESDIDTIIIKHDAKSRDGFAMGALDCAKWLIGKKGYFTVENYIDSLIYTSNS